MSRPGADRAQLSSTDPRPAAIELQGVTRRYAEVMAVQGVDLRIDGGEFFSLLGASGCGKTTLLRLIAGLDRPDTGRVLLDGVDVSARPAHARPVNTVFQSYALFPHMNVAANVGYGLRREGLARAEVRRRVAEMLDLFSIGQLARRRPDELSGGQRQRVALCRALVKQPRILLLDEPMAALDKRLREQARFELKRIQSQLGITFLMVTHDQDEAMSLSTRVAVMDAGRIVQIDRPEIIYGRPANRFVADFVGDANFFDARVERFADGRVDLELATGERLELPCDVPASVGQRLNLMLRPERIDVRPIDEPGGGAPRCSATVAACAFLGHTWLLRMVLDAGQAVDVRIPARESGTESGHVAGKRHSLYWSDAAAVLIAD
ncbi:MAG: ABC transporter ATP-binding protein [Gammaproteobacteria bacterium]|nr:ABC transporter ATP-binding protein [Gammaproteobacteria bacterium]